MRRRCNKLAISLLVLSPLTVLAADGPNKMILDYEVNTNNESKAVMAVSYTHLTLPTTPYV